MEGFGTGGVSERLPGAERSALHRGEVAYERYLQVALFVVDSIREKPHGMTGGVFDGDGVFLPRPQFQGGRKGVPCDCSRDEEVRFRRPPRRARYDALCEGDLARGNLQAVKGPVGADGLSRAARARP